MIDIKVETFLKVCQTMNYTRAAQELGFTQPSVSQHIRNLEDYYHVKLFIYKNKKLEITEAGQYLKKNLETLSHDVNRMREAMKNIAKKRKIRMGATLSIGEFYIPDKLSAYIKKNPEVEIVLIIADTKELLIQLDLGEIDFILCEGYFDKNQYEYELIEKDEMCIVCSENFEIGDIRELSSLFKHHILLRETGSGTREIFENYLHGLNYSLENFSRCSEFTSPHVIKKLLADGIGISVLYKTVVEKDLREKRLREIVVPDFQLAHEFNAVWKSNSIFGEEYRNIIRNITCSKGHMSIT